MKISRCALTAVLFACVAGGAQNVQVQGLLADWNCVKPMVENGREKTFKNDRTCSLGQNYSRAAYGIITSDKRYFKLDDTGRSWALQLLKDTPDKDNLRVVVNGDLDGATLHVKSMSEL